MKTPLQVMSDLHLEFFPNWYPFVEGLPVLADILVLAGDIHVGSNIVPALCTFGARFRHVIFVPGNHELYDSSPAHLAHYRQRVKEQTSNVHWLDRSAVTIEGQRFLGATLWFSDPEDVRLKRGLTDFYVIRDFEPWVYEENDAARDFLESEVTSSDVVITHHLPHPASIAPKYRGDKSNVFFLHDMTSLIERATPRLWIHGHTHESVDVHVGPTRIVCNPYGYEGREVNTAFRNDLVIEV